MLWVNSTFETAWAKTAGETAPCSDRQKTVIEANAYREAEQIRGEGDAIAAEIYANAYNQDPEFYSFHRSIQAYKSSFAGKDDLLVIDPESDFFRYLKNPDGK